MGGPPGSDRLTPSEIVSLRGSARDMHVRLWAALAAEKKRRFVSEYFEEPVVDCKLGDFPKPRALGVVKRQI